MNVKLCMIIVRKQNGIEPAPQCMYTAPSVCFPAQQPAAAARRMATKRDDDSCKLSILVAAP